MYILLISWSCLLFGSALAWSILPPTAKTTYGYVQGQFKLSRNGNSFQSFTGIPYAKPPLGNLRFAGPKEPKPWNCTRDATREPPVCIQRNYLFSSDPSIEGSEDCLYLNVFVPEEKIHHSEDKRVLLPVMVFIHWGAFIAGRSTTGYIGPEYFMDKGVILVTFNYRVGPFGFLSTTDDEAPGNYGLKDQVAVLKWVRANIHNFGGNKHNVTIFGQSAGAGSVHYHLLSSASKGLFHRAISQSGSALSGWAFPRNAIQKSVAVFQAKFVGCGNVSTSSKDLVRCLREVPAEKLMLTQDYFRIFNGDPLVIFGSVVEKKSKENPNPFLIKTPIEYILNGEISNVPWITGVVKNEGVLRAASLIRPQQVLKKLNQNFKHLITEVLLNFALSTTDPQGLYKNVTEFYLSGKDYVDIEDPTSIQGLIDLYSDRAFIYPLYQSILLHSYKQHAPIYLYNFEYEAEISYTDVFAGTNENIDFNWGTCHCDDLLLLFKSPDLFGGLRNKNDKILSNLFVSLWTNFAKYGNPNPPSTPVVKHLNWKPLNRSLSDRNEVNSRIELLNIRGSSSIGPTLEISRGFYEKRIKFWSDSNIFENILMGYELN